MNNTETLKSSTRNGRGEHQVGKLFEFTMFIILTRSSSDPFLGVVRSGTYNQ